MSLNLKKNRPLLLALLFLFIAHIFSVVASRATKEDNTHTISEALEQRAEQITDLVQRRIQLYQYGLRGARAVVITSGEALRRERFSEYSDSRDVDAEFPGARGFGFIRRVPAAEVESFVASAQADDFPDFTIRQLNPHQGERFVIQYIEPVSRNLAAVGLDIASEANRRNAAVDAMRSGEVRLTGPITLVQATGQPMQSFLILMPVYKGVVTPPTVELRERLAYGWSYAPLLMTEVLANLQLERELIHLTLRDITDPDTAAVIYDSAEDVTFGLKDRLSQAIDNLDYRVELEQDIYGRRWQFEFEPHPAFLQSLNLPDPTTVFFTGMLFAVLGSFLVYAMVSGSQLRRKSNEQAATMAAMVESAIDSIVSCDLEGKVISWNPAAARLFGFEPDEALGTTLSDLIVPADLYREEEDILAQVSQAEAVPHFNTRRKDKQGRLIDVSIAVSPLLREGKVAGYSTTIRDNTIEVQAQRQILEINQNLEAQVNRRTKELMDSKLSLQGLVDNIPFFIAYWDTELRNVLMNRHYLELFGLSQEEAQGKTFIELVGEEYYGHCAHLINGALKSGEIQVEELEVPNFAGEPVQLLFHAVPQLRDERVTGVYTIFHDVSELNKNRRRIDALSRENAALLNTINQQLLFSVTDDKGRIIDVNDNFCRATGFERDELLGKDHRLINSWKHSREFWREVWQTILAGQPWQGEICNRSKTGRLSWFDTVISPFVGADGRIERFVALRTDITDKRAAEEERAEINQLLGNVLDAASEVAIIATDPDSVVTIFNSGAENMLGYSAEEMLGKPLPPAMHLREEVVQRGRELSDQFGEAISGFEAIVYLSRLKKSETRQWTYVRKDGSTLQVSLAVTAMRDEQGQIVGYLGVAIDITEQDRSRRELLSARDQLAIAAEVSGLGVWSWNLKDDSLQWNDRMYEIYEYAIDLKERGLDMEHWMQRIHPKDKDETRHLMQLALEGKAVFDRVFRIVTPEGEVRSVQAAAQVERDQYGNPVKVTGINRDITQQLQLESELRRAKDMADSSNAAKSAFLANMSHEIRTPMNAVMGMLQLVQATQLDKRQQDYIGKANSAAKSLLGLLNDILDVSKIEAGKLTLEQHPFDLEELMADLGVVLSGYQGDKPLELLFDIDPLLPRQLQSDRLRLQQVLINLGGNAMKFTEQGLVVVKLEQVQRSDTSIDIRFTVSDSGIGISKEQQQRIFEGFTQAEASTARRFGGTGLGLMISQRLVRLLGGELQLTSEPGKGSRFWFELKLPVVDGTPVAQAEQSAHILLVEDDHLVAEVVEGMLLKLGYQVEVVHNSAAAIGAVQTLDIAQKQPYDLVLMDWNLPDITGAQAAKLIAEADARQAPKVLMITAHGKAFAESQAEEFSDYYRGVLIKPVTPQELSEAITCVLNNQPLLEPSEEPELVRHRRLDNLRLLIVEDNELNRQVAAELLAAEGARVELAEGGQEGVDRVIHGHAQFDLVVMDMQMPEVDGLEATRRIRADGRFDELPILAMTANASASDREDCLAAGMNEHVGKPIDMEEVVPMILALTGGGVEQPRKAAYSFEPASEPASELAAPQALAALEPEPVTETKSAVTQADAEPGIESAEAVLKRFGGNAELFARVQSSFYPEVEQLLARLQEGMAQQDVEAVLTALHSIKGTAATLGAVALSVAAASLEARLKDSPDGELSQILGAAEIASLQRLFESSNGALAALATELAGDDAVGAAEGADAQGLTEDQLQQRLREVVPLLDDDNLRAIDAVETLYNELDSEQQQRLEALRFSIGSLEFAEARTLVAALLES